MSPKLLLIDDDRVFAKRLVKEGQRLGATVDWYPSFSELGRVGRLGDYDCVIADLSADPVSGIEIARYATAFFSDLPVVLVGDEEAGTGTAPAHRFAPAVEARITKEAGAAAVMRTAMDMCATKMICPPMPRARATTYRLSA